MKNLNALKSNQPVINSARLKSIFILRDTIDPSKDGEFNFFINYVMETLELTDEYVARLFDISVPTVNRWRNGTNSPRPAIRKFFIDYMMTQLKEGK